MTDTQHFDVLVVGGGHAGTEAAAAAARMGGGCRRRGAKRRVCRSLASPPHGTLDPAAASGLLSV